MNRKRGWAIAAAVFAVGLGLAAGAVYVGVYDISATDQHLAPTYRLLDTAMRRSVKLRAAAIDVPALDDPAQRERGLALYARHCVPCHGAPGVAPEPFALGLTPSAANLAHTGRDWPPAELYWVVRNGIKMTGMPAWQYRMSEDDLWAVIAFLKELPSLSPRAYRARAAQVALATTPIPPRGPPDPQRGLEALRQYACSTCHRIPGVVGPNAPVGPPLEAIGSRALIAGQLPNQPANMVRWLRAPQRINPDSAMPDLGVSERDAWDMAAYLAELR